MKAFRAKTGKGRETAVRSIYLLRRRWLAVSIYGTSLRLLLFNRRKVLNWAHIPFNPALLRNGFIANSQGMSQVLRNALASKGLPPARVVAAFPGFQSLSRVIQIPRAKEVRPQVVVPREARRLMAFSDRDHYLFWQRVATSPSQQSMVALAVPKAPLQTFVETLKLAGLSPSRVELAPLCLLKAVSEGQTIAANVEADSIDIVIAVDSIPQLVRSLWLGDEPLDIDSAPARLAEELVRTISFYNDANPEARLLPPLPIYVAGGFPTEELAPVVAQETGHPVMAVLPRLAAPDGFPAGVMAVNLGLAVGR